MKNNNLIKQSIKVFLVLSLIVNFGCERDLTDEAVEASFPITAEVFTDNPVGLTDQFFESFDPNAGANVNGFGTDDNEAYLGTTSIRIDVPAPNDPDGGFIGGIFRDRGAGRNLTGYDALTFWAKGSTTATVGLVGFGTDFIEDKYAVGLENIVLSTDWKKYIIPIPDPSKLTQEQGMFIFSAGTNSTGGLGYTFWLDEIRFEKLGNIAQPRPAILLGQDQSVETFIGSQLPLGGLVQTFNLPTGIDQTVTAAPAYFDFTVTGPSGVINISEQAVVNVVGASPTDPNTGDLIPSVVTATLAGLDAEGSFSVGSLGDFSLAPQPDEAPENVISIFSDAYTNVPVDYYNGFFNGDGQTTQGGAPPLNINGEQVINYTDLNFVGVGTFLNVPTVDATEMTHFHVDINVQEAIDPSDFIRLVLIDGVGTANEISGSYTIPASELTTNGWESFDIPLGNFAGLSSRDQMGLIFFVSDATISNIYVDNIYYYKEILDPSPNVDDSAATQVALPVGWESSTLTYDILGFEGANSAVEANPDPTGINPTANVLRTTKTVGAQFFAGTLLNLDTPIDFSTSQKLRIKVWSPKSGIPIRVRLENVNNSVGIELDSNTTTANQWEELQWDFSGFNTGSTDFVRVVVFFEFIPGLPGDGSTYYYDDIQIID